MVSVAEVFDRLLAELKEAEVSYKVMVMTHRNEHQSPVVWSQDFATEECAYGARAFWAGGGYETLMVDDTEVVTPPTSSPPPAT